jgi:DNA polymerase I-like protein with 3'-5' exonuclease and polymerase domains
MGWAGVAVDPEMIDSHINTLRNCIEDAINAIPWTEGIQKGAKSPKQWNVWCRERGKVPPKSMAKDQEEVLKWMRENPAEGEVLESVHILGGANGLLKKLITMRDRVNEDSRFPFGLKYFGAYPTGRDSGDAGFNIQNLPREEMYGIDLRKVIVAPPGKCLLSADYGQIEARCCAYMAGETEMLAMAKHYDWYESMARAFGLYTGESPMSKYDPKTRHVMKQMCLGCQYKMGVDKFAVITKESLDNARTMVKMFRARMPKLSAPRTGLWDRLENAMKQAARSEDLEYTIELPSGRILKYENVQYKRDVTAEIIRNGKKIRMKYWAGILMENAASGLARDIFMWKALELREAGHNIVLRVHDEFLFEVDESSWEEEAKSIQEIMTKSPEWCKSLPLGTEIKKLYRYTK